VIIENHFADQLAPEVWSQEVDRAQELFPKHSLGWDTLRGAPPKGGKSRKERWDSILSVKRPSGRPPKVFVSKDARRRARKFIDHARDYGLWHVGMQLRQSWAAFPDDLDVGIRLIHPLLRAPAVQEAMDVVKVAVKTSAADYKRRRDTLAIRFLAHLFGVPDKEKTLSEHDGERELPEISIDWDRWDQVEREEEERRLQEQREQARRLHIAALNKLAHKAGFESDFYKKRFAAFVSEEAGRPFTWEELLVFVEKDAHRRARQTGRTWQEEFVDRLRKEFAEAADAGIFQQC
jgi:hypothetical protein